MLYIESKDNLLVLNTLGWFRSKICKQR